MADFNEAREREAFEEWRLHYWRNVRGFGGRLTVEEHREQLRTGLCRDEVLAAWQAALRARPDTALLKDAADVIEEAMTYTSGPAWSPSMTEECSRVLAAIKQALEKP